MFVAMSSRLPESRLALIELDARKSGTLRDRVVCELVEEIRSLRRRLEESRPGPGPARHEPS
jgi:hypothetical protein